MLLKFATPDIFNTAIVDCATGDVVFRVATSVPGGRSRSRSGSSLYSFASSYTSSRERLAPYRTTSLLRADGTVLAEITWEGEAVTHIRIGEEHLEGNCDIFAVDFVKVFPDETLVPTRMEYVWRITLDALELLDDDRDPIGILHTDSVHLQDQLSPASRSGSGRTYLEFTGPIPADELPEVILTFLLITTLRERMYWVTRVVYGKNALKSQNALHKLRHQATRSIANLRDTLLRRTS